MKTHTFYGEEVGDRALESDLFHATDRESVRARVKRLILAQRTREANDTLRLHQRAVQLDSSMITTPGYASALRQYAKSQNFDPTRLQLVPRIPQQYPIVTGFERLPSEQINCRCVAPFSDRELTLPEKAAGVGILLYLMVALMAIIVGGLLALCVSGH